MDTVLQSGEWMLGNRPLIVRPWMPKSRFDHNVQALVPVSMKLPNLDLYLWLTILFLGQNVCFAWEKC